MSLFLETIRIENGRLHNPDYHIRRMLLTADYAGLKFTGKFPASFLESLAVPREGLFRLRIIYSSCIEKYEIIPYSFKEIRSLKIISVHRPEYSFKYADRTVIDNLYGMREECDDVLIVSDNIITDTSYCNVALEHNGKWFTPARPLLKGTMRESLLDAGILSEKEIFLSQLDGYSTIRLFNAMIPWERAVTLPVSAIRGL
ncbi:MAG: 4-amino-4-deoxychorismate lyase [Bacteroidales bacterium]|nr:4-amino-4-deoxychorismate lyase [Bacteroidales bacterium]